MFQLDNQFSHNQTLEQALQITRHLLTSFATDKDFYDKMSLTFGNDFDREEAKSLAQDWITGSFNKIPSFQIIDARGMNGAVGAFSCETNTIYLSNEYLIQNSNKPELIAKVLLEEFGHFIDTKVNLLDSPGDEGAKFAAYVRSNTKNQNQLQLLEAEDDTGIININGINLKAEFAEDVVPDIDIDPDDVFPYTYPDADLGGNSTSSAKDLSVFGNAKGTEKIIDYLGADFDYGDGQDRGDYRDGADFFKFTLDSTSKVRIILESAEFRTGTDIIPEASVRLGNINLNYTPEYGEALNFTNKVIDFETKEPGTYYFYIGVKDPDYSIYKYNAKLEIEPILGVSLSNNQNVIGIEPEQTNTYTLNITNNSTQSAKDATAEIVLPRGVTFVNAVLEPDSRTFNRTTGETRLKFTIPTTIAAGQKFSTQITTKVTGFSQPLDKLQDYLWNIDVKGSATANISGANVDSNTASISTQVDSSIGLAESLTNNFLLGFSSPKATPNSVLAIASVSTVNKLSSLSAVNTDTKTDSGLAGIVEEGGEEFVEEYKDLTTEYVKGVSDTVQTVVDDVSKLRDLPKQIATDPSKAEDLLKVVSNIKNSVENTKTQTDAAMNKANDIPGQVAQKVADKTINYVLDAAKENVVQGILKRLDLGVPKGFSYKEGYVGYEYNSVPVQGAPTA